MFSVRLLLMVNSLVQVAPPLPDTIRFPVTLELLEETTPAAMEFGKLSGLAVDRAGTLYISDISRSHIWVFDSSGRPNGVIGRKGQGPGEFQTPSGVAFDTRGRLYVRDLVRVTRFVEDPERRIAAKYDTAFRGPMLPNWYWGRATRFDQTGRMYYPRTFLQSQQHPTRHYYYRYDGAGRLLDSIAVPQYQNEPPAAVFVREGPGGGPIIPGLEHVPFAPIPVWDATPRGTVVSGNAEVYDLDETDEQGRLVRRFARAVPPDQIDSRERRDSTQALRRRLDSLPVARSRVEGLREDVASMRIPETYPAYQAVFASTDGSVWVRRWPVGGRRVTIFDVFDADGRFRLVVLLPRVILNDPTPVVGLRGIVAVVENPETGALGVLRFGSAVP